MADEPQTDGTTPAEVGETAAGFLTGFFSRLWDTLIETFGPAGPYYAIAALGMVLAVLALPLILRRSKDPLERFSFGDGRAGDDLVNLRSETEDNSLQSLAGYLEPSDSEQFSEVRKQLRAAGYNTSSAVRVFYFARAALGIGLLAFAMVFLFFVPEEPDLLTALGVSAVFGLAGYFIPSYWVKRQIASRKEQIQNAFPDAMDMMLVCIEGGQSLDQAMARVGQEMKISAGPLADELQVVSHEFRAGKDRTTVLRDLAERCAVNDISSFVTVLIQSSTFGTSISSALRVYAAEMRDKRLMRAEEKANVLPTKLTLGTMMFTVPPLILILVGPSVIQIIRSLAGLQGAGGG